jgi:hexosaminidase
VNSIHLHLDPALNRLEPEGYWLLVGKHEIHLTAASPSGIFYGTQTLRQLLPTAIFKTTPCPEMKWIIPGVEIEDAPRFAWRGVLLDVGRHFMPKDFILRMLDLLALHKMNTFHWHLTEDQGWRIEIKKYPRLTQVGARRKETLVGHANDSTQNKKFDGIPHQGFYTQAEIREVVEYARQRFITIVPEIEMPGHIQAALAAYPELGNTSQLLEVGTTWGINHHICNVEAGTIQFMQAVLSEVLDLFPGQYIHIGGDEVPTGEWRESPAAQKRLKELGLADETQLQGYFLRCMESFLHEHGRKLIGWDEILEDNLSREAAIMSWRCNGSDAIAANQDRQVVVASEKDLYLDHYQLQDKSQQPLAFGGYTPLSQVYQFEPVSAEILDENRKQILGVQAQLWSEYIPTPARMEYMAFPRLCAVAEIAWTNPKRKDYANFIQRLSRHEPRLDGLQVQYCQQNE